MIDHCTISTRCDVRSGKLGRWASPFLMSSITSVSITSPSVSMNSIKVAGVLNRTMRKFGLRITMRCVVQLKSCISVSIFKTKLTLSKQKCYPKSRQLVGFGFGRPNGRRRASPAIGFP